MPMPWSPSSGCHISSSRISTSPFILQKNCAIIHFTINPIKLGKCGSTINQVLYKLSHYYLRMCKLLIIYWFSPKYLTKRQLIKNPNSSTPFVHVSLYLSVYMCVTRLEYFSWWIIWFSYPLLATYVLWAYNVYCLPISILTCLSKVCHVVCLRFVMLFLCTLSDWFVYL